MPFEHGYTSTIFLPHPKNNKLYQLYGLSNTQAFVRQKRITGNTSYFVISRISFSKLKVKEIIEVYEEMIKYYNFVINLNK